MNGDFDYIIVGSGAGGGPLAANLAKMGFKVLLLEAGDDSCSSCDTGRLMYEVPIFPRTLDGISRLFLGLLRPALLGRRATGARFEVHTRQRRRLVSESGNARRLHRS